MGKIFLFIPDIKGTTTAKGFENWIQVNYFHFSANRSLSTLPGNVSNRESSRPVISEVTLSKTMDASSPQLFLEAMVGKTKQSIKIELTTATDNLSTYMQYTLFNAIFTSYKVEKNSDCKSSVDYNKNGYPIEQLTISFDKIENRYTTFNANNQPQSPISTGYDLIHAKAM